MKELLPNLMFKRERSLDVGQIRQASATLPLCWQMFGRPGFCHYLQIWLYSLTQRLYRFGRRLFSTWSNTCTLAVLRYRGWC